MVNKIYLNIISVHGIQDAIGLFKRNKLLMIMDWSQAWPIWIWKIPFHLLMKLKFLLICADQLSIFQRWTWWAGWPWFYIYRFFCYQYHDINKFPFLYLVLQGPLLCLILYMNISYSSSLAKSFNFVPKPFDEHGLCSLLHYNIYNLENLVCHFGKGTCLLQYGCSIF